jgi:pSer/pThr/pTyr-binding forkhead associated (FHA) protein
MFCSQCGNQLPPDARFCPSCGAPARDAAAPPQAPKSPEQTTASIEIGALDQTGGLEDVPDLEPGTGMLVVIRGPNVGSRFLLDRGTTTIGRHPDSHIFLDDVTVSRRHAEVERGGDTFTVSDLGSLNGTYVNGDRVEERALRSGDEVQVGRFKLMFVGSEAT